MLLRMRWCGACIAARGLSEGLTTEQPHSVVFAVCQQKYVVLPHTRILCVLGLGMAGLECVRSWWEHAAAPLSDPCEVVVYSVCWRW